MDHNLHRLTEHVGVRVLGVTEAKGKPPAIDALLIRAGMSLNRRFYPEDVLQRAVGLYESRKVMLDHADWLSPESVRNIAAVIKGAVWDSEAKAVHATILPATDLESGQLLLNLARSQARYRQDGVLGEDEHLFGFSHVVLVSGRDEEPENNAPYFHVEDIREVMSVDAVAFPAAGGEMKDLAESRRTALLDRLEREGQLVRPEPSAPTTDQGAPERRKVTIMSKKTRMNFDLSGVVVSIEGVERATIEPALQASAQEGYDKATAEAQERVNALEAENARIEGERDAAQAELARYREAEEREEMRRDLDARMEEQGVPAAARPTLMERIDKAQMSKEQAENLIDTYAEGYKSRLADVTADADPDVPTKHQEATEESDAESIGAAFFEAHYPGAKTPADSN